MTGEVFMCSKVVLNPPILQEERLRNVDEILAAVRISAKAFHGKFTSMIRGDSEVISMTRRLPENWLMLVGRKAPVYSGMRIYADIAYHHWPKFGQRFINTMIPNEDTKVLRDAGH